MIDIGPPPKFPRPAIIRPRPAEIIRPGDPCFVVPNERRDAMFMLTQLVGFGAANDSVSSVSVVGTYSSTSSSDLTTYTFSSVSGISGQTHLFIIVSCRGAAARTVSSITVDGNSATLVKAQANGFQSVEIWAIAESSSNPTIVVTWSGGCSNMALGLVACTGINSLTAIASASVTTDAGSIACNSNAGGIAIGGAVNTNSGSNSCTWTGLANEMYDTALETSFVHSAAYELTASAESPRAMNADWSSFTSGAAVAATFR